MLGAESGQEAFREGLQSRDSIRAGSESEQKLGGPRGFRRNAMADDGLADRQDQVDLCRAGLRSDLPGKTPELSESDRVGMLGRVPGAHRAEELLEAGGRRRCGGDARQLVQHVAGRIGKRQRWPQIGLQQLM